MKILLIYLCLISLLLSLSCLEQKPVDGDTITDEAVFTGFTPMQVEEDIETVFEDTFNYSFKDFDVEIKGLIVYDEGTEVKQDTVDISVELTSPLDHIPLNITLKNSDIETIEVFENYKNVLSIMNEGPHYDMYDWKSYTSEWKKLNQISPNHFITDSLTEKDISQFPDFTKEELEKYLVDNGDTSWVKVLNNPNVKNWRDFYYIGDGLRTIKFVITYKNKTKKYKFINIYIPMGC